jgi:hypothetical protein
MCWICLRTEGLRVSDCLLAVHKSRRKRTRQRKQDHPVHHQHRPEDRQVKDGEPSAHESNGDGLGSRIPELELGESPDKGAEFILFLRWKFADAVFHALILFYRRVKLWRYKSEEEVEKIDA